MDLCLAAMTTIILSLVRLISTETFVYVVNLCSLFVSTELCDLFHNFLFSAVIRETVYMCLVSVDCADTGAAFCFLTFAHILSHPLLSPLILLRVYLFISAI